MRTAISVGALALALGGALVVLATPADAAGRADDCGGGLLGEVTGSLCGAVGTVGEIVNGLTAGPATSSASPSPAPPPTAPADGFASPQGTPPAHTSGPASPTSAEITAVETGDGTVPTKAPAPVCAPPRCTPTPAPPRPEETTRPRVTQRPGPSRRSRSVPVWKSRSAIPPRERPRPPEPRPRPREEGGPTSRDLPPVIDAEAPRVELLWPADPIMRRFQRAVTPTRSPDPLGTALTATLLIVAIFAVRLLYTRRADEKSMPLEPLRARRHRTA